MSGYAPELTPAELAALVKIGRQLRGAARGLANGRTSLASILARRMGKPKSNSALRALLALPDLNRPTPDTLRALARSVRRPELADQWIELWGSIDHPRGEPRP